MYAVTLLSFDSADVEVALAQAAIYRDTLKKLRIDETETPEQIASRLFDL